MKAVAFFLALATSALAQYSSSLQRIGGLGEANIKASPSDPQPPGKLRANMRYLTPAKVKDKMQVGSEWWLCLEVKRADISGDIWVADHPEAAYAGIGRIMPCVVVVGPSREEIDHQPIYYWFASGPYDVGYVRAFQQRRPGVPLE